VNGDEWRFGPGPVVRSGCSANSLAKRSSRYPNLRDLAAKEAHVEVERPLLSNVAEVRLPGTTADAAFALLERVTEQLRREIHVVLRGRGITWTQYNVLRALQSEGSGGLTCSELGSRLAGTDPDITRLLDRLAKQRLVRRRRDMRDRRAVLTEITEEGRLLIESVIPSLESRIRELFEHMAPARLQLLIDLLDEAAKPPKQHGYAPQSLPTARAG
jgi:DNA-binding MarR family transcriptional regulator